MSNSLLVSNWSKAIFELYNDNNKINILEDEINGLIILFKDNNGFVKLLSSTVISLKERKQIIDNTFIKKISNDLVSVLKLLVEKGIFSYSISIFKEVIKEINIRNNVSIGTVFSVIKLTANQLESITNKFGKYLEKKIKLSNKIDKQLIGGIKVIINDTVYDYSIINNLNCLKNKILK